MKKRFLSVLTALALCLTLLPAASLAAGTAPSRVTLAGILLESGKSYIPKADGGIKETTDSHDTDYLTYDDGVLTVYGTVEVSESAGLNFYDGTLTLTGGGALTIEASDSNSAVSGSPQSTLTTADEFSGNIILESANAPAVQNVKLDLTTGGSIRISSAKNSAVNTPQNPVTLKGGTVTIETTANSAVSVSTVAAPSLNVTAGGDVTITGNGNLPLIAGDSGKECAVTLNAGGNVEIGNKSGSAVYGPLTVAKAVDVTIGGGGNTTLLSSASGTHSITASGTVKMESGGIVCSNAAANGLTITGAKTVEISSETSAPVVTGMTLRGCGAAFVNRLGNSESQAPIVDKVDSDIPVLLYDEKNDIQLRLLWKNDTYQRADAVGREPMAPNAQKAVYYEAGDGYVMFSQLSDNSEDGAASAILFNAESKDKRIEGTLTGIEVIGENALQTIYVSNLEGEFLSITGTGTLNTIINSAVLPTMVGSVTFNGLVCVNKEGTGENPTASVDCTAYGNSVLPQLSGDGKFVVGAVPISQRNILVSLTVQKGATLTIPDSVTLEISDRKYLSRLTNHGTLVNNSTVSIPDATAADIKALHLTGSGLVQVSAGMGHTYYTNGGAALGNLKTDLDLSTASSDQGVLETDGYHWNNTARSLTLNGLAVTGTLTLPNGAENIKIAVQKESLVNRLSYADSYRPTVRIVGREPLTVKQMSGMNIRLTVEQDAALNAGEINIGGSGNADSVITVKGKLTVKGKGIRCGQMVIDATGVLNVSGEQGVAVFGVSGSSGTEYQGAFQIAKGGTFTANCTDYNVMVLARETIDEAKAKTYLVLPENYLPKGYAIRVVKDADGQEIYAATVAPTGVDLTLKSEHVSNAGGQLELESQTASKPGTGGGGGNGGNGTGGGGGNGGNGSSSGSSSNSTSMYAILVAETVYGSVTPNVTKASQGTRITVTVKPDSGYTLEGLAVTDAKGSELKTVKGSEGIYIFTMPASKVTVTASFKRNAAEADALFSDVSDSAYYYEAVKWAREKGITGGIGNGLFGPNQPCTRAQIVTFLWRAAGSPVPKGTAKIPSDVLPGSYCYDAVAWAIENGITNGFADGTFGVSNTCTRGQSVTFLFRAIGKLVDSKAEFSDVLADSYYANAVAWAVENGITNGIGDGMFGSDNSCTRAQIVTFLFRAYRG